MAVAGPRRILEATTEGGDDARTVSGHLVRAEPVVQPAKRCRWPVIFVSSARTIRAGERDRGDRAEVEREMKGVGMT